MEQKEPVKHYKEEYIKKDPTLKETVTPTHSNFDINKLAKCVAKHETGNCTLGY